MNKWAIFSEICHPKCRCVAWALGYMDVNSAKVHEYRSSITPRNPLTFDPIISKRAKQASKSNNDFWGLMKESIRCVNGNLKSTRVVNINVKRAC